MGGVNSPGHCGDRDRIHRPWFDFGPARPRKRESRNEAGPHTHRNGQNFIIIGGSASPQAKTKTHKTPKPQNPKTPSKKA